MTSLLSALFVAYVPGALIFRLPVAQRDHRATLPSEERVFWYVIISLAISSVGALSLAALGWYSLERLLWTTGALSLLLVVASRGRLRLGKTAPRPGWTALIPVALLALSFSIIFYVPPAEYVMGGKDPGTYMNEGVQIAQRGTLGISDPLVASVPRSVRDLFFPERLNPTYHSSRFMGFFVLDPDEGRVVGQFPHLYPVWIAIGYGANGLSGARQIVGLWAILGVLAIYFAGSWLVGRPAATAGAVLLSLHVTQVWYGRYPNAEILLQVLIFSGLLAFSRASVENNRFFAPLAAVLLCLSLFAHFTAVLAVGAVAGAAMLGTIDGRRLQASFLVPLVVGTGVAMLYFSTVLGPYFERPILFLRFLEPTHIALGIVGLVVATGLLWSAQHRSVAVVVRRWLPWTVVGALWSLAVYAYFFRKSAPGLAVHDAEALRVITNFYLTPIGLVVALLGLGLVVCQSFWPGLAYVSTAAVFSCFFFFKMRIVPEHFWTARRFLPVILPTAFLLIGAVAFPRSSWQPLALRRRGVRVAFAGIGVLIVLSFGYRYLSQTEPILEHVEYAGLIAQLERLNAHFEEHDLVLVESRQASDMHVLALPLAYVYARDTLVLSRTSPNPAQFRQFLQWAAERYQRIFFVGGGGTELISQMVRAIPVASERFQIPEYEQAYRGYPREVRFKEFDFGIYELRLERVASEPFDLDIGTMDDLFVRRFHAKEVHGSSGTSFRWTRNVSFVSLLGITPERRTLTVWASSPRPDPVAQPPTAEIYLEDRYLGMIRATPNFEPYRFEIPIDIAEALALGEAAARLRIESIVWTPAQTGGLDTRELGLMIDRITIDQ